MSDETQDGHDYLPLLDMAIERFAALLSRADGAEPVPSCPGWSVSDLAVHLGTIHRWAAGIVLTAKTTGLPEPIIRVGLPEWYAGTASALSAALRAVDPAEYAPNFSRADETAAFWHRRQLHETLVHTVDLALALDASEGTHPAGRLFDGRVAADGVDEVLTTFFRRLAGRGTPPVVTENILIRAEDTDRTWVLGPGDPPELLDIDARAAAIISGSAADLYLGLWGRAPHNRLHVTGAAAAALLAGPTCS